MKYGILYAVMAIYFIGLFSNINIAKSLEKENAAHEVALRVHLIEAAKVNLLKDKVKNSAYLREIYEDYLDPTWVGPQLSLTTNVWIPFCVYAQYSQGSGMESSGHDELVFGFYKIFYRKMFRQWIS